MAVEQEEQDVPEVVRNEVEDVDDNVTVGDHLSGFSSGSGKAQTEDHVVKSALEKHHQVGTGLALLSGNPY